MQTLSIDPSRRSEILEGIKKHMPWYHRIDLGDGVCTRLPGDGHDEKFDNVSAAKLERLKNHLPEDMSGKTLLDVGCCNGLFSLEAVRRHAARVVGIDQHQGYVDAANWLLRDALRLPQFRAERASVYTHVPKRKFDFLLCYGLLYHVLDPFYVLARLRMMVKGTLFLHTYLFEEGTTDHLSRLVYTPHLKAYNNILHSPETIRTMLEYVGFDIQQEEIFGRQIYLAATARKQYFPAKYNDCFADLTRL